MAVVIVSLTCPLVRPGVGGYSGRSTDNTVITNLSSWKKNHDNDDVVLCDSHTFSMVKITSFDSPHSRLSHSRANLFRHELGIFWLCGVYVLCVSDQMNHCVQYSHMLIHLPRKSVLDNSRRISMSCKQ